MANKYLDYSGLQELVAKIKNLFAPKDRGIEYIRGTWTAASNVWTGVSEDSELYDGKQIILYMPFAGTSSGATLNLTLSDGTTTGAKNVYFENTTRFTTHKGQNSQLHLIYHSAQTLSNGSTYEGWWFVANRDTTDTSTLGLSYSSYKTKAAVYRYVLLFTVDEQYLVPANSVNNNTGTSKTLTTESFDPFGQIYYWNTTNTLSANATVTNYLRMQQGLIDLRYSFNTGSTLTANKSAYLVVVPQSDGHLVKLDSNPISQDLPTTDDGKLYIYLGQAYDTYRIQMHLKKPVYCYKNGAVREYGQYADTAAELSPEKCIEDSDVYLYRAAPKDADLIEMDQIIGGTIAWNQIAKVFASGNWAVVGGGTVTFADGVATFTPSAKYSRLLRTPSVNNNHVYLISVDIKAFSGANLNIAIGTQTTFGTQGVTKSTGVISDENWHNYAVVGKLTAGTDDKILFQYAVDTGLNTAIQLKNAMVFDLTQMFGSTIADYIYSLETATAGAGVAFFIKLFPKPYYAYNAGELLSVEGLQSHKTVGFNLWDEEWDAGQINQTYGTNTANINVRGKNYIPCLPQTTYYFKSSTATGGGFFYYYDADKNYLSYASVPRNTTFATPANTYYMRFHEGTSYGTTYGNNICINFSDPVKNGTYEPYVSHSYALDSSLTLRGVPKLVDSKLQYDGDIYKADGTVTRKYGIVDMGTLTWSYYTGGTTPIFISDSLTDNKKGVINTTPNVLCPLYTTISSNNRSVFATNMSNGEMSVINSYLSIAVKNDSYLTADAFKSAMDGVYLVYELETPTTEYAAKYRKTQELEPYGTEEFVSNSQVPVGSVTRYLCEQNAHDIEARLAIGDIHDVIDHPENIGVTGIKGNAESSYRKGNVNLTPANIGAAPSSHTHSADDLTSGYVNIHPENNPVLIPFIHNDIAHLLERSGSDVKLYHDGVEQTNRDLSPLFDGSGAYFSYNAVSLEGITEIVIEITCHKVFTYSNWVYIDFGASNWRSKSVKIEVMNATTTYPNDVWTEKFSTTTNSIGHVSVNFSHTPVGASNSGGGFNKIRVTFSNFNSTQFRIAQIGVYNYGSLGLRETYMSRGKDDAILRNLTPDTNSTYDLGKTNYRWRNVVATNFIDSGGNNLSTQISQRAVSLDVASTANLNDFKIPGFYTVGGSSNITNRPPNTDAFGFIVTHNASGNWYTQIAFSANQLPETVWMRTNSSGTWSSWKELIFTDTVTTVTTTGSGNAITSLSASNGAITATKDSTFLTSHQDISGKADKTATVSSVAYDSTNKKITKTINGVSSDVVTVATLKTDLGIPSNAVYTDTVTTVSTTGSGNAITSMTAVNGALTATKGAVFLTSQDILGKMDIPSGGVAGQVLTKTENGYEWADPITLGAAVSGEVVSFDNIVPSSSGGVTVEQVQNMINQAIAGITDAN